MKQNLKERVNGKNGITLIALVITIIVLLILAGVTIATLTGDNGILTKAQNAKEKNAQKTVEEQINLAVQASKINEGLVIDKDILEQELTNNGIEITKSENDELPWTVKKDGYVYTISENGEVKEKEGIAITTGDIEILKGSTEGKKVSAQILSGETGTIKWEHTGNITLSETEGNEVTVNVNSNANAGDIATITARIDGKTYQDSINVKIVAQVTSVTAEKIEVSIGDKKKIKKVTVMPENAIGGAVITDAATGVEKTGNEFVWVPVDTLSNMAVVTSGTDANGNINYRGVLYNWGADATGNTAYDWSADSTSYREPANLSSSYDSTSKNSSWTSTLYQEEYNKMIKSVSQYGGFYVGRYEMSLNSETKNAESKYGATSANAKDTDTNQWYGLYNKAKTYAPEKNSDNTENASQKVVSSMIWGSQYDTMMNWMKGNNINVTSSSPTDLSIGTTSKNTTRVTGGANNGQTVSKDKLSNIYDLLGNSREWTQEANNTNYRVYRGGYYNLSYAPSNRLDNFPTSTLSGSGVRLTLYIK